ncbi:glycosyl transferase family 1 [candidate division LCP-89 bacterium B3_LCP]|uniref:Glycosyl transferase family 1 n=1 Tax=candidate division LCP-89 bacterium B3_LCP TaxID=2012998 RepID=A0A532UXX3_UNCL8|nr:MAG: glycosyl transferase family 1 [candidate division LCP-89 bacterium B3_LCP]
MTIYLLGPFYPLRGGIAQYIGVLGKKLLQREHKVKILSFKKQFPKILFPGRTQVETSKDVIELASHPVFVPWNPLSWFRTFSVIRRERPGALIIKYWMPFFAPGFAAVCALTKWFTKTRIIFIIDNVIPHERIPFDRILTRLCFRWGDGYIVQSQVVQDDLYMWFPEAKKRNVRLTAHPLYDCYSTETVSREEAREKLGLNQQQKVLLFFGLIRQYKGLQVLLDAMPEIIQALGSDVRLLIAGEFYEPEEKYRSRISDSGIQGEVVLENRYIPNEEVGTYFKAADLLVLPYLSATQSGVVQVAYNFELPVISTKVGGLPEVVIEGQTGYLVPPDNPAELAGAVADFFNQDKSAEMKRNIKDIKQQYSWDEMLQAVEELSV